MLFSIKFRLRNQNHNPSTNLTPLYCRLSINGVIAPDFFTGVRCIPTKWDVKRQSISGYSREVLEDNKALDNIRTDLKRIINDLSDDVSAVTVRNRYLEKEVPPPTLIEMFQRYIVEKKECFNGTDQALSKETIEKWYYSKSHLERFVGDKFKMSEIRKGFEHKYYTYLIQLGTMHNDHAVRNVNYLASVLDYAVQERLLEHNCIAGHGLKKDAPKDIVYLTSEQVELIEGMTFENAFQESIDLFLFICYTSLDNNELRVFDADTHIVGNSIVMVRGKTIRYRSKQYIPILPKAKRLLEKYNNKLPVHQTYTLNRYLHVIEKLLGFKDNLTTKVGRKTAGMFFLINDVPLEVVSRILGHKSIQTTQRHYADVLNSRMVIEKTKHLL